MSPDKEREFFQKRMLDLSDRAERQQIYTCSNFLTPLEQAQLLSSKELFFPFYLTGGSALATRKIVVFGSEALFGYPFEDPIRVMQISPRSEKFAADLTHRDYLGSMMALGIDRSLTGDILVRGKEAFVYVLESIIPFLSENLTTVKHSQVICRETNTDIPQLEIRFETLTGNIASERLDLLVAFLSGNKRDAAKDLLSSQKVFLNGYLKESPGQKVEPGDEITIRGYGKFIYDGIRGESRKGRLFISVRKYI